MKHIFEPVTNKKIVQLVLSLTGKKFVQRENFTYVTLVSRDYPRCLECRRFVSITSIISAISETNVKESITKKSATKEANMTIQNYVRKDTSRFATPTERKVLHL